MKRCSFSRRVEPVLHHAGLLVILESKKATGWSVWRAESEKERVDARGVVEKKQGRGLNPSFGFFGGPASNGPYILYEPRLECQSLQNYRSNMSHKRTSSTRTGGRGEPHLPCCFPICAYSSLASSSCVLPCTNRQELVGLCVLVRTVFPSHTGLIPSR